MNTQFDREEEYLEDQLACGEISTEQFNKEMREMQRSFRAAADEAAQDAYEDAMNNW